MGTAALISKAFTDAANDRPKRESPKPGEPPLEINLKLQSLRAALALQGSAMLCAQKAADLLTAMRLINEFHLDGQPSACHESRLRSNGVRTASIQKKIREGRPDRRCHFVRNLTIRSYKSE